MDTDVKKFKTKRMEPMEEHKSVELVVGEPSKTTRIGSSMSKTTETLMIELLRESADLFAWSPSDFRGIDPKLSCTVKCGPDGATDEAEEEIFRSREEQDYRGRGEQAEGSRVRVRGAVYGLVGKCGGRPKSFRKVAYMHGFYGSEQSMSEGSIPFAPD
ncbi:UNVERIFIED_CONTAM: hypothetical protein Slati_1713600 [Sesamum latifolium]|uniref:Uncharacterized protein n=1 Tax=Sesamum latifolium TaxID=2727402 RepID=A0AAW2WVE8_9LAMI